MVNPVYPQEADNNYDDFFEDEKKDIFSYKIQFKELFNYYKTESYSKTGEDKNLWSNLNRIRFSPELDFGKVFIFPGDFCFM